MSTETMITALQAAQLQIADVLTELTGTAPPPPPPTVPTVDVQLGDNLASLIELGAPGTIYRLPTAYRCGALDVAKPCTLARSEVLPEARMTVDLPLPTIEGQLTIRVPDVTLSGLAVLGTNKDWTLLQAYGTNLLADRVRLLGSPNGQKRGVYAAAAAQAFRGCYIGNCWHQDDAQAVLTELDTNGLLIDDCFLEASGENFMAGGGDCWAEARIPQNITIRNSHLFKPLAWRGKAGCSVKNLLELKNAKRVLVTGNLLEHNWKASQTGYAIVLAVRNQYGRDPWATIQNVEIVDNTLRGCGAGVSLLGRDYTYPSDVMARVAIRQLRIEDFSMQTWASAGGSPAPGRIVQINRGPQDLTLEDWTVAIGDGTPVHSAMEFINPAYPLNGFAVRRCQFYEGPYGIQHDGTGWGTTTPPARGAATLAAFNPNGYDWESVTIVRNAGASWAYPPGTIVQ